MEAEHYSRAIEKDAVSWQLIPDIGRTGSGMTPFPVTADVEEPGCDTPRLEYDMHLFGQGEVAVWVYLSPRNNFLNFEDGLQYAVSFDNDDPQKVNTSLGVDLYGNGNGVWERHVGNNTNLTYSTHVIAEPGEHVLKFWMVTPGVILQKIVVDLGGMKPSYLGPPESYWMGNW